MDAWSTAPGVKPIRRDVDSIVRQAQQSTEHAGDADSSVGLEGESLRHTDVQDSVGGGSSLGSSHLGSAALTAALTLHPCVFLSGCGDAYKEVLTAMISTVGNCAVTLVLEEGVPTGEASATFASASVAEAAIRTFDGSRFDDGVLRVSVSRRSAQGSFTTRGRGRGNRVAFSAAQSDLISDMRLKQVQDEKAAFAEARAAAVRHGAASTATASHSSERRAAAALEEAAAKRRKLQPKLPGVVVVSKGAAASAQAVLPPAAASAVTSVSATAAQTALHATAPASGSNGEDASSAGVDLLGLGAAYGSSSDDEAEASEPHGGG